MTVRYKYDCIVDIGFENVNANSDFPLVVYVKQDTPDIAIEEIRLNHPAITEIVKQ